VLVFNVEHCQKIHDLRVRVRVGVRVRVRVRVSVRVRLGVRVSVRVRFGVRVARCGMTTDGAENYQRYDFTRRRTQV